MSLPTVKTQIDTYGELKKAVQLWMDRDDPEFVGQIGNFINFAEKEIYRTLRMPMLMREIYLPIRNGVAYIPTDFLEFGYMIRPSDGRKYRNASLYEYTSLRNGTGSLRNNEAIYTRLAGRWLVWPEDDAHVPNMLDPNNVPTIDGSEVILGYYRDSKEMDADDESGSLLSVAPDYLLYTVLKHACVFVQDDEGSQKWDAMAATARNQIEKQLEQLEWRGEQGLTVPLTQDTNYDDGSAAYAWLRY